MKFRQSHSRRGFLQLTVGSAGIIGITGLALGQENEPSVVLEDQKSDGTEISVKKIVTTDPVNWRIHGQNTTYADGKLAGGKQFESKTFELESKIKASRKVWFSLFPPEGGTAVSYDGGFIEVTGTILGLNEVNENPSAGFNYPYFLYVPPSLEKTKENVPIFVETPVSTDPTDNLSPHIETAKNLINRFPSTLAETLNIPALVPVIPHPESKQQFEGHPWFQGLDVDSLRISDHSLARIDLQVLQMIDDARERLHNESYKIDEKVMMNGFSTSAKFANRFSILHPERVMSVSAGGLSGMVVLPREETKDHTLNYHIGIADLSKLIGKSPDLEAFANVQQYYYMGSKDLDDNLEYRTLWPEELAEVAREVFGEDIIEDRFPYCEQVYDEEGVDATFKIYEGVGHTSLPAENDVIDFHRENLANYDLKEDPTEDSLTTAQPTIATNLPSTNPLSKDATSQESETESAPTSTVTRTESPGLNLIDGIMGLLGASYIGVQFFRISDD